MLLLAGLLMSACSQEPVGETASGDVEAPPSVREGETSGQQLVRLRREQAAELKVRTVVAGRDTAQVAVTLPGQVQPAPDYFAQVSAPISGRVVRIHAHEGEAVRQGQPLLALESLEFANLAADYLQAAAEEAYQQRQVERLRELVDKKIAARSRLDRAEADLSRTHASVSATHARLRALGITDAQMERWSTETRERPLLQLYAPISGAIDQHDIDLGQSVTAYQAMMTIISTEKVLIRGFVSPEDAPMMAPGDPVTVSLENAPGQALDATVTTINPSVDPQNRSVTVNIITPTRDRWPMPGQTVRLSIQASNPRPVMMLPLSAVQYEGEQAIIFVRRDPLTYEKRPITVDRLTEDQVIVAEGLDEGEEVAVTQIFSLKALGRYELYAEE
ncbi:MAG: efflux RND transporter periplasmic adaptor subunit [Bacteroidetes bacterium]|nr:efflux RND transporter periplasmic adaptor subunit [Bacteroidota bacterium]